MRYRKSPTAQSIQPYSSDNSPLELLPLETKLQILSHLSPDTASNLAQVSRSWRDPAESVIWRRVDLTLSSTWEFSEQIVDLLEDVNGDGKEGDDAVLEGIRSSVVGDAGGISGEYDLLWSLRQRKLHTRINQIRRAITSRLARAGYIKHLHLEPGDGLTESSIEIVEQVRTTLTRLHIGPLEIIPSKPSIHTNQLLLAFANRLKSLPSLEGLTVLEIGLHPRSSFESQFLTIFSLAPNLTSLIIGGHYPTWSPDFTSNWPSSLPDLLRVKMINFEQDTFSLLAQIARTAPNLQSIAVECKEPGLGWVYDPILEEGDIKALREHKSLRKFVWKGGWGPRHGLEKICEGGGFDRLKVLVQSEAIECESETYIENIHLPPFQSLRTILIPCRSPKWYRRLNLPDWAKAPPPRFSISSHTITQLRQTPSLLQVQFIVVSSSNGGIPVPVPVPVDVWCDKRVNGVLVRSYTHPRTGEEMYHLRRLALLSIQPKLYEPETYNDNFERLRLCSSSSSDSKKLGGNKVVGKEKDKDKDKDVDHNWIDHTSYKGYPIPDDILRKVYKLRGDRNAEWKTPGRGMELPEEAWEVLRKWRGKLPDAEEGGRTVVTRSMVGSVLT
ncbi:hypothetical protein CI109_105769 [Kwoniella shandongensis]|uniref:Uncharacterized protein n=1 Tax=Kwoniella shandongensis TaxID=1734106 RepID=A0A5M6C0A4_9TREE|nr:uncharacterized protein CI109_003108 [Kwoniella shandongensis]KAA5528576.1 hypothetical protein CI109_003108 [Kwoniella shandongensis]